jgi:hypothetical protein
MLAGPSLHYLQSAQFPLTPSLDYDAGAACTPPRHRPVIHLQGHALGGSEQLRTITTRDGELIQMKVLHSVKKHDPITMPEVRLALLKLLENYAVRIRNRPTQFVFPISDRHPIGFARRL